MITVLGIHVVPRKHLLAVRARWLASSACQTLVRRRLASSSVRKDGVVEEFVEAIVAVSVTTAKCQINHGVITYLALI